MNVLEIEKEIAKTNDEEKINEFFLIHIYGKL